MTKKSKRKKESERPAFSGRELAAKHSAGPAAVHAVAFWGLAALLFLSPFFRGLYFPENQQVALFFAIIIFWLTWLGKWMKGDGKFLAHPLDWLVLAFPLAYLVSSFNAANTGLAVNEVVKTLLYFLIYWSAANLISGRKGVELIFNAICLAGVFVSLAGLASATESINIKDGFLQERIYSTFQYPNALASYLMVVVFLSLYMWLRDDMAKPVAAIFNRYFYIFVSYLTLVVFAGTKSSGSFLVFFLALTVYFIGLSGRRIPVALHLIIAGGPAFAVSIVFLRKVLSHEYAQAWLVFLAGLMVVFILQFIYDYFEQRGYVNYLQKNKAFPFALLILLLIGVLIIFNYNKALSEILAQIRINNIMFRAEDRLFMYKDAIRMIAEKPLLGWGGGGWYEAYQVYQGYFYISRQVHGHYLQIAVETGLTGLMVIAGIWACFLQLTYKTVKNIGDDKKILFWTAFISAFILGIHAVIDFDLSLSAIALILWTMWGLMRSIHRSAVSGDELPSKKKVKIKPNSVFIAASVMCVAILFFVVCLVNATSLAKKASVHIKNNDIPGAVSLLEKASSLNPFNPDYNVLLSSLYFRQGKMEIAASQAEMAIAKGKYDPLRYYNLSSIYSGMRKNEEAIDTADKAVKLVPWDITAYNFLLRTYFTNGYNLLIDGQKDQADLMFKKAVKVHEMIAAQASKLGTMEKRLWTKTPLEPSIYTWLYSGAALFMLGEYDRAEDYLSKVPEEDKRAKAESFVWISYIYKQRGNLTKSNQFMEKAKDLVPEAEKEFAYIFNITKQN